MHASSTVRRQHPFAAWIAALVLGATAHTGWLVHDLHERSIGCTGAHVPADRVVGSRELRRALAADQRRLRLRSRSTFGGEPTSHCRSRDAALTAEFEAEPDSIEPWVRRVDRHHFEIDRRVLHRFQLSHRALSLAHTRQQPMELRNIRRGTPLFSLGLRNGDRVLSLVASGEGGAFEGLELEVERRGKDLAFSYELI